jgi:hypothetical protein
VASGNIHRLCRCSDLTDQEAVALAEICDTRIDYAPVSPYGSRLDPLKAILAKARTAGRRSPEPLPPRFKRADSRDLAIIVQGADYIIRIRVYPVPYVDPCTGGTIERRAIERFILMFSSL